MRRRLGTFLRVWIWGLSLALVAGLLQSVVLDKTLPEATAAEGVTLHVPRLLHGNGAVLSWSRYASSSGVPFNAYEVHRGTSVSFTPSASTLVTRIADVSTTSFADDSAAGSTTYWYRVVAGGTASAAVEAALPPAGQSRLAFRMDPSDAATYLTFGQSGSPCGPDYTMGGYSTIDLGVGVYNYVNRALLRWDFSAIPAKARVTWAVMDLNYPASAVNDTGVRLHRVLQPWTEGTGASSCSGAASGATWGEAQPGVAWRKGGAAVVGGAFDATPAVSLPVKNRSAAGADRFELLSLVQSWVNGTPNHGMLLKQATEGNYVAPGTRLAYHSDQSAVTDKRPSLLVQWEDASKVAVTTARVTSPEAGAVVRGTTG